MDKNSNQLLNDVEKRLDPLILDLLQHATKIIRKGVMPSHGVDNDVTIKNIYRSEVLLNAQLDILAGSEGSEVLIERWHLVYDKQGLFEGLLANKPKNDSILPSSSSSVAGIHIGYLSKRLASLLRSLDCLTHLLPARQLLRLVPSSETPIIHNHLYSKRTDMIHEHEAHLFLAGTETRIFHLPDVTIQSASPNGTSQTVCSVNTSVSNNTPTSSSALQYPPLLYLGVQFLATKSLRDILDLTLLSSVPRSIAPTRLLIQSKHKTKKILKSNTDGCNNESPHQQKKEMQGTSKSATSHHLQSQYQKRDKRGPNSLIDSVMLSVGSCTPSIYSNRVKKLEADHNIEATITASTSTGNISLAKGFCSEIQNSRYISQHKYSAGNNDSHNSAYIGGSDDMRILRSRSRSSSLDIALAALPSRLSQYPTTGHSLLQQSDTKNQRQLRTSPITSSSSLGIRRGMALGGVQGLAVRLETWDLPSPPSLKRSLRASPDHRDLNPHSITFNKGEKSDKLDDHTEKQGDVEMNVKLDTNSLASVLSEMEKYLHIGRSAALN